MSFQIDKQRSFSSKHDYLAFSVIRLHPKVLKKIGGRGTWVKISNENASIYRICLGARSSVGFTMKAMEIDYDSHLELGQSADFEPKCINGFYPCSLTITRAGFFGKFSAHWNHPNPGYRVPMQLSIVGFSLGILGLVLGIMGFA